MSIRVARQGRGYVLETVQRFPQPRDAVFPFFADATNLELITPSFLRFRILTPPPLDMRAGRLIDYRIRLRGVPVRWRTEIEVWEPPERFVDVQRRGPYRWWRHEHVFRDEGDCTTMIDRVEYAVPFGAIAHRLVVERDLRRIFGFRRRRLEWLFAGPQDRPETESSEIEASARGPLIGREVGAGRGRGRG